VGKFDFSIYISESVANVTRKFRFANGLPGLSTAFADRSPVFVVTSSPPLRDAESNCLQGFLDQALVANPITKFSHRITVAEEIPRLVSHAYRLAISGPPGKDIEAMCTSFLDTN
jgi:thiamine pyrophosphate-dependent acetolactate synthase large subunit-like protein